MIKKLKEVFKPKKQKEWEDSVRQKFAERLAERQRKKQDAKKEN